MIKVSAIAHATFDTLDLERMPDYDRHALGLVVVERVDNVVLLIFVDRGAPIGSKAMRPAMIAGAAAEAEQIF